MNPCVCIKRGKERACRPLIGPDMEEEEEEEKEKGGMEGGEIEGGKGAEKSRQ